MINKISLDFSVASYYIELNIKELEVTDTMEKTLTLVFCSIIILIVLNVLWNSISDGVLIMYGFIEWIL